MLLHLPQPVWPVADIAGLRDQRPVEVRDDVLVYTTPTLTERVDVVGNIEVSLYLASNVKDTDLTIKLVKSRTQHMKLVLQLVALLSKAFALSADFASSPLKILTEAWHGSALLRPLVLSSYRAEVLFALPRWFHIGQ